MAETTPKADDKQEQCDFLFIDHFLTAAMSIVQYIREDPFRTMGVGEQISIDTGSGHAKNSKVIEDVDYEIFGGFPWGEWYLHHRGPFHVGDKEMTVKISPGDHPPTAYVRVKSRDGRYTAIAINSRTQHGIDGDIIIKQFSPKDPQSGKRRELFSVQVKVNKGQECPIHWMEATKQDQKTAEKILQHVSGMLKRYQLSEKAANEATK